MGMFNTSHPPFFNPRLKTYSRGRLAVIYYVPKKSLKYNCWSDGFTAAMEIISESWDIDWIHADGILPIKLMRRYDAIYVKSNWDWRVDQKVRKWSAFLSAPCFLVLSGSLPPPEPSKRKCYSHVFYETSWYGQWQEQMPSSSRAFGVNTDIYHPKPHTKKWDVIGVGALKAIKRWDRLANRSGQKLLVGEAFGAEAEDIRDRLQNKGVEVREFQPPEKLRDLMLSSRLVYIPAELHGGGERAVWEARACGLPVEVEADNPKLKSLLSEPIWDHSDYAQALLKPLQLAGK